MTHFKDYLRQCSALRILDEEDSFDDDRDNEVGEKCFNISMK